MPFYYDFENPPEGLNVGRTAANLIDLRAQLDAIPAKTAYERLLVASWNIKMFGAVQRNEESYYYIAEILSRFDVIAIQEVRNNLKDLEKVCGLLGPWWKYVVTDVTEGGAGNDERLAFLYDTRKLLFSGLAGELVLEPVKDQQGNPVPVSQFARTPFVVGFKSAWFDFMMSTVHLYWGGEVRAQPVRVDEARQLAQFLADRATDRGAWARNMILLGDFNIFDEQSPTFQALVDAGFTIPHQRAQLPPTNVGQDARFYDQIAYLFADARRLRPVDMGVVDFFESVYSNAKFSDYQAELRTSTGSVPSNPDAYYRNTWRRNQMSDHLVLWLELKIDFAAPYLSGLANA